MSGSTTLRPDRAAMRLDQVARDRQPEPRAGRAGTFVEAIDNPRRSVAATIPGPVSTTRSSTTPCIAPIESYRQVDRWRAHRTRGPATAGTRATHRTEQCEPSPDCGRTADLRHRLRAEPLQPGASERRWVDRQAGRRSDRLRAVFPARRVCGAPVLTPLPRCPTPQRHDGASGARVVCFAVRPICC